MILLAVFLYFIPIGFGSNVSNAASYEYAADFIQPASAKQFNCLVQNGCSLVIFRGYSSKNNGFFDQHICANMKVADQVGIDYEVYLEMNLQSNKSVEVQFNEFYNAFTSCSSYSGRFWITVTQSGNWTTDINSNISFINKLRNMIKSSFPKSAVGIKTHASDWKKITNDWTLPSSEQDSLWYSNFIVSTLTFIDYKTFGGWEVPDLKQYLLDSKECSITVNRDSLLM